MVAKDTTRCQIMEAARKRFIHFGYAKTTMAEVAADCAMSPGNLYRFFPGKLDIAEAIATSYEAKRMEELERLIGAPAKSARQRLRDFLFGTLKTTHRAMAEDPRMTEIARIIRRQRPQATAGMLAAERKLIMRVLREGNASGEFHVEDPAFTAETIQSATLEFRYPHLWADTSLSDLERKLDGVLMLIFEGLAPRMAHEAAQ